MAVPTPTVAQLGKMALLGPTQRQMVEREISSAERALRHGTSMDGGPAESMSLLEAGNRELNPHLPDVNILKDQQERNLKTLRDGSAPEYSPQQKNQLWRMAKELRDKIRHGMPSHEQMERPTQENLDVFRIHEERTIHQQLALRNIHRILDDKDETVVLETLRPTTPSHVNWEEYYGNFDKIFFSDAQELEYQIQTLDDDTYSKFLGLRVAGVTARKLIMQKLNISLACYEACMKRLADEMEAYGVAVPEDVEEELTAPGGAVDTKPAKPAEKPGMGQFAGKK